MSTNAAPQVIRVKTGEAGRLIVEFPYSPDRILKIKTIPGRAWHPRERHWTIPDAVDMLDRLRALFVGDIIEAGSSPQASPERAPTPSSSPAQDALLDRLRQAAKARHFSPRTEDTYAGWARRFLRAQEGHAPEELGETELGAFLSRLAVEGGVSASTQNQALNALLFLFQEVLGKPLGLVGGVARAKKPARLPVVLARDEVMRVLAHMSGSPRLMATLLYGAGLRLMECCRLRAKDIDFSQNQIVVRAGKGDKDRYTMLPAAAREPLMRQLERVRLLHLEDLRQGLGSVALPNALDRKYPNAPKEWGWQWAFPASSHYVDAATGEKRRHHIHETVLQKAFREARLAAGIAKPAGCHALLRDALAGGRLRHPDRPGAAGPARA